MEEKIKVIEKKSYFDGSLLKLYGWRFLSFLITLFSLGICASWGQCMVYRYKINHTIYNGKRLKFEGSGKVLFFHRMKTLFLSIVTIGIYAIFVPVKRAKWVISNIHFEDEKLNDSSYFEGKTIQYIGINTISTVLSISSFGLLMPFIQCYKLRWINNNTTINGEKLYFNGNAIELFAKQLLWALFTIITLGLYVFWLPLKMLKWQAEHTVLNNENDGKEKDHSLIMAGILLVIGIVLFNFVVPKFVNYVKNSSIFNKLNIETVENE